MVVLGCLIGLAEIILGIFALVLSDGQGIVIGAGIGYMLSGLLYIWLSIGSHLAYSNSKTIDILEAKYKKIKESDKILRELLIEKGIISKDDIDSMLKSSVLIKDMEPGFPLITLKDKTIREGSITIPKGTQVLFSRYDDYSYPEPVVVVNYEFNGEVLRLRYGKDDVVNAYSFKNEAE